MVSTSSPVEDGSVPGIKLWPVGFGLPARQKLLELITEAKTKDPLAQVTVITTDGAGLGVLRRLVATLPVIQSGAEPGGAKQFGAEPSGAKQSGAEWGGPEQFGIAAVSAVNLGDIAQGVLEDDDDWLAKHHASDLMLGGVIREVLATEMGLFANVKHHPATEQALLRVSKELSDLTNEQLEQVRKCSRRAEVVVDLFERVRNQLDRHKLYLWADVQRQATENENISAYVKRLGTVVLYLPLEPKDHQSELIQALASHTRVHVVAGITGDALADKQYEQLCNRLGVSAERADDHLAGDHPGGDRPVGGHPVGDRIVSTSDADDEVRWVVRSVMSLLSEEVPAKQIAILYPATVPYARLIAAQLDQAGLCWHGGGIRRLSESVAGRFAMGLAELIGTDLPRSDFFDVLSDAPVLTSDGEQVPVAAWERIARAANVVAGDDWDDLLEHHVEVLENRRTQIEVQEDETRLAYIDEDIEQTKQLREFVSKFKSDFDQVSDAQEWIVFCDWFDGALRDYLGVYAGHNDAGTSGDGTNDADSNDAGSNGAYEQWPHWQQSAAADVTNAIGLLKQLASVEAQTTTEVMCRALIGQLNQPARKQAKPGEGIFVGQIDRGVDLTATHVYVMGMTEGTYPTRRRPDSMITEDERQSLAGALVTVNDHILRQYQALQAVLAGTKSQQGTTTLLYPRGDLRNSARNIPSRWLLDTAKALEQRAATGGSSSGGSSSGGSGSASNSYFAHGYLDETNLEEAASDKAMPDIQAVMSFAGGLLTTDFPATRQEFDAASLLAAVGKERNPVDRVTGHSLCQPGSALAQGIELTSARYSSNFTRFDGNLGVLSESEKDRLAQRAFGDAISASALETWAACPRAYLFGRLLKITPIEEPGLLYRMSPLERGNIVHKALDLFLKELLEQGETPGIERRYTAADVKRLNEFVDELLAEQTAAGLSGNSFYAEFDRQQIKADMAELLTQDERRSFSRGTVIASEHGFGIADAAVPAVEYQLKGTNSSGQNQTLKLRGVIDRVELVSKSTQDGTKHSLVVIDYKTGSTTSYRPKDMAADPTVAGTKLQLAVYAIAAADYFKAEHELDDDWANAVTEAAYWFVSSMPGGWEARIQPGGDRTRQRVDAVLNMIFQGIAEGEFPGYSSAADDRPGARYCAFCSPDGLSNRELRKQWDAKFHPEGIHLFAALTEPESDDG